MGFLKKLWKDRQVEHPARRKLIATGVSNEYDVIRSEGNITQEGSVFNAANMNDLENRISNEFTAIKERVIRSVTITRSQVYRNREQYMENYPFYADYAISGMTDTCTAEVVTHPSADEEGCYSGKCNTMTGKIRLYFLAQPVGNTTIEAIIWKELA